MMSTTQDLSLQVDPIAKVSVPTGVSLAASGTTFGNYAGSLTVSYRARTSPAAGGSITLQAASEFTPAGGPAVAAGALSFACTGATLGSGCSGAQTVSAATSSPVVTLPAAACTGGGGACSSADPNTVRLNFTLINKPTYQTGIYTIQLTLNVSSF